MGGFRTEAIGAGDSTSMADKAKKYKERYSAMMEGVGSFGQTVGNLWQNAKNGNVDLSGVSVFNDNGTCAFNS